MNRADNDNMEFVLIVVLFAAMFGLAHFWSGEESN